MQRRLSRWCLSFGFCTLLLSDHVAVESKNENSKNEKDPLVEVRAVYINCEPDERQDNPDNPSTRFERQELFKHNALRGCNKKLALTVKIASPSPAEIELIDKSESLGDEYIPIDHVFEGPNRKRLRLLNPYILRLRRESPKQAYKLHRIDTVSSVLMRSENLVPSTGNSTNKTRVPKNREVRDVGSDPNSVGLLGSSIFTLEHANPCHHSYSVRIGRLQELIKSSPNPPLEEPNPSLDCGLRLFSPPGTKGHYTTTQVRTNKKRVVLYENNVLKDKTDTCLKPNSSWGRAKRQKEGLITVLNEINGIITPKPHKEPYDTPDENKIQVTNRRTNRNNENNRLEKPKHTREDSKSIKPKENESRHNVVTDTAKQWHRSNAPVTRLKEDAEKDPEDAGNDSTNVPRSERDFALYEIGDPNLLYNIKVQLFEKMSTPEGKTVWNDLTNGLEASVSSVNPEWKSTDVNVRYRPAEWVPRDEFTLPSTKLCLLEPLRKENFTTYDDEPLNSSNENYIVVPIEDIVYTTDKNIEKRDGNASNDVPNETYIQGQAPHRVEVRISRAIIGSEADNFDVTSMGADRFLILPHRRPHHSQIEVEVRADDNQLVRVGSSGRLATIVSDNTRRTRTTIHFQATNTGLASARFKAAIRDCGPELTAMINDKGTEEISTDPILLPPQHTRRLKLDVPVESPVDITHCNVALINDADVPVAVREVSIRKGDRCYCVWHCECVCLGEDPKLLCREMSQPQQLAAGLTTVDRPRYTRSICYRDSIALDVMSVMLSVLIFLLLLGLIKAIVGLCFVKAGQVGWCKILESPRILERYYEPCLRCRNVVYRDGWPVHPDTKEHTVRILSPATGFLLNLVFFVVLPSIVLKRIFCSFFTICNSLISRSCFRRTSRQIYQARDLQSESLELIVRRKRKRNRLREWMTPDAKQLAEDVLEPALDSTVKPKKKNKMQPLLHETKKCCSDVAGSLPDSEQEDTEYVLMQMQKSRESLAKSQKKVNDSPSSTAKNLSQTKTEALAATSKQ